MIRNYDHNNDYEELVSLYKDSSLFGWKFDEDRNSSARLSHIDPQKVLVAEMWWSIVWTVSLLEDGRAARLYRFAVKEACIDAIVWLYKEACKRYKQMWYKEVLVYAPRWNTDLEKRYSELLWMKKWWDYTCFRTPLEW